MPALHQHEHSQLSPSSCAEFWSATPWVSFPVTHSLTDEALHVAMATGRHLSITAVDHGAMQQLLGPFEAVVECMAFCAVSSHLAVGVHGSVAHFVPDGLGCFRRWYHSTKLLHEGSVHSLAWTAPMVMTKGLTASRALWIGGGTLCQWLLASDGKWSKAYHHVLAYPVRLMAASASGHWLATAGYQDRLVKVWPLPVRCCQGKFAYLYTPNALLSLDWWPGDRLNVYNAQSTSRLGLEEAFSDAVLLTLGIDGISRLWHAATEEVDGPWTMLLMSVFTVDGVCVREPESNHLCRERRLLWVQWAQPTSQLHARFCSPGSADANVAPDISSKQLNPGLMWQPSPLITCCGEASKHQTCKFHDFVIGQLVDGTLVVWLIVGLTALQPRCTPKSTLWATVPRILASGPRILAAAAFCSFKHPSDQLGTVQTASMQQFAEDQLPCVLSIVAYTLDEISPIISYTIDMGHITPHKCVLEQQVHGHDSGIVKIQPHLLCAWTASLDATGDLMVWSNNDLMNAPTGLPRWRDPPSKYSTTLSTSSKLRLVGSIDAVAWISHSLDLSLVAFDEAGGTLYVRSTTGLWKRDSSVLIPSVPYMCCRTKVYCSVPWVCAQAFESQSSKQLSVVHGFAFRAGSSSVVIWAVRKSEMQVVGCPSLARCGSSALLRCAVPLHTASGAVLDRGGPTGRSSHHIGTVLCGYSDGSLSVWALEVRISTDASARLLRALVPCVPHLPTHQICTLALGRENGSVTAAATRRALHASPATQSDASNRLHVLEMDSTSAGIRVAFDYNLNDALKGNRQHAGLGRPLAIAFGSCDSVQILALGAYNGIFLFAHKQSSHIQRAMGEATWSLLNRITIPGHLPCTSLAWSNRGALLAGIGPSLFATQLDAKRFHTRNLRSTLALQLCHPTQLRQQLLARPKHGDQVNDHLGADRDYAPLHGYAGSQHSLVMRKSKHACDCHAVDSHAPSSVMAEAIAPGPVSAADLLGGAQLIQGSNWQTFGESREYVPTAKVARQRSWTVPRLSSDERQDLTRLLHAVHVFLACGAAIDTCGARFLLYARPPSQRTLIGDAQAVSIAWALLSDCHSALLDVCLADSSRIHDWAVLTSVGIGFWLSQPDLLRAVTERAAKAQFAARRDARDCAMLYIALGKKSQLQALCRATSNDTLAAFLANDFTSDRWISAACKNAFSLLSKQRYELAVAFFLLANELSLAVRVCTRQLRDIQLAIVLCRLCDHERAPKLIVNTIRDEMLPRAINEGDRWLSCISHLLVNEPAQALQTLAHATYNGLCDIATPAPSRSSNLHAAEPATFAFCLHMIADGRWRLPRHVVADDAFLSFAYALGRRRCSINALQWLRRGDRMERRTDRISSNISTCLANALSSHAMSVVWSRSMHCISARVARSTMTATPKVLLFSVQQIRAESKIVALHSAITKKKMQIYTEHNLRDPGTRCAFPVRCILYASLAMWDACTDLFHGIAHSLERDLCGVLPHEHSSLSCQALQRSAKAVVVLCSAMMAKGVMRPSDFVYRRVSLAAHCAAYTIACSLNDVCAVLLMLQCVSQRQQFLHTNFVRRKVAMRANAPPAGRAYVWHRFHGCSLRQLRRQWVSECLAVVRMAWQPRVGDPRHRRMAGCVELVVTIWLCMLHRSFRGASGRLLDDSCLLDIWNFLPRNVPLRLALMNAWGTVCRLEQNLDCHADLNSSDPEIASSLGIWHLENQRHEGAAFGVSIHARHKYVNNCVELYHRKGDFVRAICVNALNHGQLAVAFGHSLHQLKVAKESAKHEAAQGSTTRLQEKCVSEHTACCLCAHPKLPLYLVGGRGIVECRQFGQAIQGQGVTDHVRAQYKLGVGRQVSKIRISPFCSEQYGSKWHECYVCELTGTVQSHPSGLRPICVSLRVMLARPAGIDDDGTLRLWRFQSSGDMPLATSRLQCHSKCGADLCFVGSSSVLATVGLPQAPSDATLALWDVLLPPSRALISSCAAHTDGARCVAYCAVDLSLISGGQRGEISVFDLRQRRLRQRWCAHESSIEDLALLDSFCFSASSGGDIKLWSVSVAGQQMNATKAETGLSLDHLLGQWQHVHDSSSLFDLMGPTQGRRGISTLALTAQDTRLISGGADGKLKLWHLGLQGQAPSI